MVVKEVGRIRFWRQKRTHFTADVLRQALLLLASTG